MSLDLLVQFDGKRKTTETGHHGLYDKPMMIIDPVPTLSIPAIELPRYSLFIERINVDRCMSVTLRGCGGDGPVLEGRRVLWGRHNLL